MDMTFVIFIYEDPFSCDLYFYLVHNFLFLFFHLSNFLECPYILEIVGINFPTFLMPL
jgi:hypothetical protein